MKHALMISFGSLALTVVGFGQSSSTWQEQQYKAKSGRYSAMEEARQKTAQESTAYREETVSQPASQVESVTRTNTWREETFKAKYGRYSPMEEARQRAERSTTAYREEAAIENEAASSRNNFLESWYKAKYGRTSSIEEARRKAEGRR